VRDMEPVTELKLVKGDSRLRDMGAPHAPASASALRGMKRSLNVDAPEPPHSSSSGSKRISVLSSEFQVYQSSRVEK